jgi:hypothetical protein
VKGLSHFGNQTSMQELALTKPLKESKKFISHSLGPSTVEKTSPAIIKILGGRTSSTTAGGSGTAQAPTHALDLFDSGSSASDSKMANPAPPWKRLRKSPVPKSVLKPFEAPAMKGTLEQFLALCLSKSYDIELFLAFVTVKMVVASVTASAKVLGAGVFVPTSN